MKLKLFKRLLPLLLFCFAASLSLQAQNIRIEYKDTPIKTILKSITLQSGYTFVYSDALKELEKKISVSYSQKDRNIESVLKRIFEGTGITWNVKGKYGVVDFCVSWCDPAGPLFPN